MTCRARGLIALAAFGIAACSPRATQPMPAKAALCTGCHAAAGQATAPIYPILAGQHAAYLRSQLRAFRAGSRSNAIMSALASDLSDDDIAALAAYYESLGSPLRGSQKP